MATPTKKRPAPAPAKKAPPEVDFRASERASRAVSPQKRVAGARTKRPVNNPGKGATVGDAIAAGGRFLNEVNTNIRGSFKSSPGLRSKGIENVMTLPDKRKKR